jgi:hypothetical protein
VCVCVCVCVRNTHKHEGVSKSFRTFLLERELQMVHLSATRCSCIAILWVSPVCFAAITLYVASQRVFIVVSVYFVIGSVRSRTLYHWAQWYSIGLRTGWSGVPVPAGAENFSLHHLVQTGSGAHPACYPMRTRGSFPGNKVAGSWDWQLTSV